ncbi:MAG: EF-P beta-lysylation protein EpmB [Thermoguttaceae bacterium]|jgi:EF-P beta-lysylation protein EpmB
MALSVAATAGPSTPPATTCGGWQTALVESVRDPAELCRLLELPPALARAARHAAGDFPLLVPRTFLGRIRHGDPCDPLLLQVLPRMEELAVEPQFVRDPLAERSAACCPGVLRKYHGRLLMVTTGACAVHCRFCFRRHFPYGTLNPVAPLLLPDRAFSVITAETTIEEIILSGGDPLTYPDSAIAGIVEQIAEIPHIRRLRIHTRLPVMIPQRVTHELLTALRQTRLATVVVVHANHAAEIDTAVEAALGRLVDAGIPVLNQAVLLRGVNDSLQALNELCRRLINLRVMPYYLHQLDRVAGAAHFEVPQGRGVELVEQLRARLPGYAVPRYVRDTPGAAGKEVLA